MFLEPNLRPEAKAGDLVALEDDRTEEEGDTKVWWDEWAQEKAPERAQAS